MKKKKQGCTSPNTYEPVVTLLSQFTLLLDLPVVDPTQSLAFPMNVVSLLPYMLLNYEDANELCIRSAENIAQVGEYEIVHMQACAKCSMQSFSSLYLFRLVDIHGDPRNRVVPQRNIMPAKQMKMQLFRITTVTR